MAATTASVRATDGSIVDHGVMDRSTLKTLTSTTYPTPPTARNVNSSGVR